MDSVRAASKPGQTIRNAIILFPLIVFLFLSFLGWRRGETSIHHSQITEFWQKEQWQQIIAMGDNLWKTGKVDSETLYAAMLASLQINDPGSARVFSERIIEQNLLNRKIEKGVRNIFPRTSLSSIVQVHRTDIVLGLLITIAILCLFALKKPGVIPWIGIFSLAGILLFVV